MSTPCCKILIYDTSDALKYTITDEVIDCNTNDTCTTSVGSFKFTLPAVKGFTNAYADIGNFYKAKIYYGYDGSYTHLFTGRIMSIATNASRSSVTRVFQGKGLAEILERRHIINAHWDATDASTIVGEFATALSLSSDIDADTIEEKITVDSETYFDALKRISDYWQNDGAIVKKDFGVNKDGELFWKTRPLRTVGVESLTDILEYDLTYDILNSKNNITVYGAASNFYPLIPDDVTESTSDWTATSGSLSASADHQVGSYSILVSAASGGAVMHHHFVDPLTVKDTNHIFCHYKAASTGGSPNVTLYAPDSSNTFLASLTNNGGWLTFDHNLGPSYMQSGGNPDGPWTEGTGHPNWWNLTGIEFGVNGGANPCEIYVDGLYLNPVRPYATATDATNITAYGQRDAIIVSDNLQSASECQSYAESQLYQQKMRVMRLDAKVKGNINYLVGDRIAVTLPLDGITASNFDLVSVENFYTKAPLGYTTIAHFIDTDSTRTLPAKSPLEVLQRQASRNKLLTTNLYTKYVQ